MRESSGFWDTLVFMETKPTPLKIEAVAVGQLKHDPANARKHDAANLAAIAGSLTQFGQRKPIVVTQDNVVVAGNGTLTAAKSLGWTEVAVVRIPADWSDDQVKAFALADNRTAELAEWDAEVVTAQLKELQASGFEVEAFGFTAEEVASEDELLDAFGDLGKDKGEFEQITFTLHNAQADTVREALEVSLAMGDFGDTGNPNKNGNAITRIVELWLGEQYGR